MSAIRFGASLAAATLACLLASLAVAQTAPKPSAKAPPKPAAKSAPAAGPWARVPAFPTTCYGADGFSGRTTAASAALGEELERQKAVNAQIEEQFRSIDPMEMAQRMQQWMMNNPQEAMKHAQATQAIGQDVQRQLMPLLAEQGAFDEERQALASQYKSALEKAYAPAEARRATLLKKIEAAGQCEGMHEGCRWTDANYAELDAIERQRDAAYQATCPAYFGAAGQVPAHLKRYRDWLVAKRIPFDLKGDEVRTAQYAIMNTPAASWRSTVAGEHVMKYVAAAESLYGLRDEAPTCTATACKR